MFSYKGDRDYIHSSDIINFINRNYLYNKIDIKFYKLLRFQPKIRLINKLGNSRGVNIIAKIEKNKIEKFILFYETKLKVKNDYSFDESLLSKYFKVNKKNIKCDFETEIKFIDIIVSMTKLWHLKNLDKRKNWFVGRLNRFKKINEKKRKNINIKVKKIKYDKFTESEIIIDKSIYGKIYFHENAL